MTAIEMTVQVKIRVPDGTSCHAVEVYVDRAIAEGPKHSGWEWQPAQVSDIRIRRDYSENPQLGVDTQ